MLANRPEASAPKTLFSMVAAIRQKKIAITIKTYIHRQVIHLYHRFGGKNRDIRITGAILRSKGKTKQKPIICTVSDQSKAPPRAPTPTLLGQRTYPHTPHRTARQTNAPYPDKKPPRDPLLKAASDPAPLCASVSTDHSLGTL